MPKSKPPLVRLSDLAPDQLGDFFAMLSERTRGQRKDGKPYYTCRFRDARRTASFMVWSDGSWFETCDKKWREGQFFKIRAKYGEHPSYGPQLDIANIRPATEADHADGFQPLDFVEKSNYDVVAMYKELLSIAESHIADEALRRLVLAVLSRHAERLKYLPATTKHFYPFAGGLIEHILSVTHTCILLLDKYATHYQEGPRLNRDLVIAGAMLHDVGRCLEYEGDVAHVQRSVPGQLLGHLFLGRDTVRDTARELGDVDPETMQLLEHIIVTHLALPEWGSPRLPVIPECLIIHHADDLDAKLEMYMRCLRKDTDAGPFTVRDPILGRQLFKGQRK